VPLIARLEPDDDPHDHHHCPSDHHYVDHSDPDSHDAFDLDCNDARQHGYY
jgi:hypothetical protein